MKDIEAQDLIQKYLNNSAKEEDIEKLSAWLQKEGNEELFSTLVQTNYVVNHNLKKFNTEKAKEELLDKIRAEKKWKRKQRRNSFIKYAAVFILFLGLGYFFNNELNLYKGQEQITPRNDAITLELENGIIEVLSEGTEKEVRNAAGSVVAVQQSDLISYKDDEREVEELIFNTLKVPYGKRFNLELSDGTMVYLNAGSSIKYPVQFLSDGNRSVEIIGEAYFKVESDPDRPFIVNAEQLNVQVLGTSFNVAAYPEDILTEVVLREGKVSLYSKNHALEEGVELSPGFKGTYNQLKGDIYTEEVNVNVYTSWREGELVFRNLSFGSILKKLERHYNVTIINNNEDIQDEIFNASFNEERIEKILDYFDETYNIDFTIKNNKIIIN